MSAALAVMLVCITCTLLALVARSMASRLTAAFLGLELTGALEQALPPDPGPLAVDGSAMEYVELVLPPALPEPVKLTPAELGNAVFVGNATAAGTNTYLLSLDEAGFNAFLRRQLLPQGATYGRFRNLEVDFRPGGLILQAEVDLGLYRYPMGVLLLQEASGLRAAGLVLGHELYARPEAGFLADASSRAETIATRALGSLSLVGPLQGVATVSQVRFHADRVEILAQAMVPPVSAGWQPLEPGVEVRELEVATQTGSELITAVRLDPTVVHLRVRYSPDSPQPVSAWAARLDPLLVINGGYFTPENQAIGLVVADGQRWGVPLGDFAGMFAVTADGAASVRWLRTWPYDPAELLTEGLQSFPVLVKPGGEMGFPADADDGEPDRRTVIAQDRSGNILVLVAPRGYLSLHELAVFLAGSDLEIDVAINLDGGNSTGMWLASPGFDVKIDSAAAIPAVIIAER